MIERVAETISRYSMFERGQRVGVAVSGGADSVCLLHVVRELAARLDLRLTVLHVNHGIRGQEACRDEDFVLALAAELGLPACIERADVPALCASGENLEQAARRARYAFFESLIRTGDINRVATGHTLSDQAETVLFRLLRGSGSTGISAIRPVTSAGIVRPLLEIDRADVLAYLTERGIPWCEDSTNADPAFARNRIRHSLLPALTRDWNPRLAENLARMAEIARDEEDFWCEETAANAGLLRQEPGAVTFGAREIAALPRALARRLLRRAVELAKGDLRGIAFAHIEDVLALAADSSGHGRCQIPGLDVMRSFDWIRLARPAAPIPDVAVPVQPPGAYQPWGAGGPRIRLELKEHSCPVVADNIGPGYNGAYQTAQGHELDWDRLSAAGLTLRGWRPGDQYRPLGHASRTKLKHLFHRAKIPVWSRRSWPVLVQGETILWVARFGPAADYAAGSGSRTVLRITENSGDSSEC